MYVGTANLILEPRTTFFASLKLIILLVGIF